MCLSTCFAVDAFTWWSVASLCILPSSRTSCLGITYGLCRHQNRAPIPFLPLYLSSPMFGTSLRHINLFKQRELAQIAETLSNALVGRGQGCGVREPRRTRRTFGNRVEWATQGAGASPLAIEPSARRTPLDHRYVPARLERDHCDEIAAPPVALLLIGARMEAATMVCSPSLS